MKDNNNIITEATVIRQPSEQEINDFLSADASQTIENTNLQLMTDEEVEHYLTSDNE